jgi:uncharacterized protein
MDNPSRLIGDRRARLSGSMLCLALGLMGCSDAKLAAEGASPPRPTAEVAAPIEAASDSSPDLSRASAPSPTHGQAQALPVGATVVLGGETIQLEVTRTVEEQAMGLMYRTSLADDRGMLFSFSPARPVQFWMKNVVISLDMVFLHEGAIVGIAADVPPCRSEPCPTYSPGFDRVVDQVIELRGGRAAELGLAVGDRVLLQPVVNE